MAQYLKNQMEMTVRIFDSFYEQDMIVPTNQFDIVYSYFKEICNSDIIAANFTAVLFRVAQEAGVDALELVSEIKGTATNKIEMNRILAYYLNSFKSKTSLYGLSIIPQSVQPVARNIVQ